MSERRRFTRRQKNAMYRGSDGRCASCGEPLPEGWHADHVIPYSVVGYTRVSGGQPLCPKCNLKKGSTMDWQDQFTPRHFQGELIKTVRARAVAGQAVTVGLIWPGSGKTLGYQAVATELMRLDLIDFLVVFAPRVILAKQAETDWRDSDDGGNYRLFDARVRLEKLRHRGNVSPLLPPGATREGYASTYQSLVSDPELHMDWARKHAGRFLLVGDEAQFLGACIDDDDASSPKAGQVFEQLAEHARHTLLLTGTPDRADGRRLVLCSEFYSEQGGRLKLEPHVQAGYRDGITNRYLRSFDGAMNECRVAWWPNGDGKRIEYDLSTADELPKDKRAKMALILRRPEVWQPMCDTTVRRLQYMQQVNREYRALITCMEQKDARNVQRYLNETYPSLRVGLAISQDGDRAERVLRQFKTQPYDVLVTVRKAFIGYDCPQIAVVCVLTNYRHFGHLTQLVFRAGRVWKDAGQPADQQVMHVIAPDDPSMRRFIEFLRTESSEGIRLRGDGDEDQEPTQPTKGDEFDDGRLEDAHVTHVRGATNDRDLTPEEYAAAQAKLDETGPITTPEQLWSLFESMGVSPGGLGLAQKEQPPTARAPRTDKEVTAELKGDASRLIGAWLRERQHYPDDDDYRLVRARLTRSINDAFGIKRTNDLTTADEVRRYVSHVERFLAQWGS